MNRFNDPIEDFVTACRACTGPQLRIAAAVIAGAGAVAVLLLPDVLREIAAVFLTK